MNGAAELFTCARRAMRLTPAGCARLWASANNLDDRPKPWEGRHACLRCPVGGLWNGVVITPVDEARGVWTSCCSRCRAAGRRIVNGSLCVSCYNRDQEARRGRNRKGNRPKLADHLHSCAVVSVVAGQQRTVRRDRVLDAAELLVEVAKVATVPVVFGWSAGALG